MSLFDLKSKVAIVTGGNGGIGLGMALGLAEAGASIALSGRNPEKNAAAAAEIAKTGASVATFATDVTDDDACADLIAQAHAKFGRVDILINNAGINIRKQPQDLSMAEWRQVLDTNLTSAFACSQAAYPRMLEAGGGKIINIGSMMSIFGAGFATAYAASKGGIVQMTKALASGWAKDNIQVNAVLPGWIDTDLTKRARNEISGLNAMVLMRTPARRWGAPADLAGIAVFLASPASDFITGTAIPVDGGYSSQA